MRFARVIAIWIGLCVCLGCATVPPPPPAGSDVSVVGIKVEVRDPLAKLFGPLWPICIVLYCGEYSAVAVYFVRTDTSNPFSQETLIPSNYASDGYVYLVNAPPGRYAAVAAFHNQPMPGTTSTTNLGGGFSASATLSGSLGSATYFSEDLIGKTEVAVEPSSATLMGELVVSQSWTWRPDDAQTHYHRLVGAGIPHTGNKHSWNRSEGAQQKFLKHVQERFADDGWARVLHSAVGAAPP
jgi:hypothetical protein